MGPKRHSTTYRIAVPVPVDFRTIPAAALRGAPHHGSVKDLLQMVLTRAMTRGMRIQESKRRSK